MCILRAPLRYCLCVLIDKDPHCQGVMVTCYTCYLAGCAVGHGALGLGPHDHACKHTAPTTALLPTADGRCHLAFCPKASRTWPGLGTGVLLQGMALQGIALRGGSKPVGVSCQDCVSTLSPIMLAPASAAARASSAVVTPHICNCKERRQADGTAMAFTYTHNPTRIPTHHQRPYLDERL